MIKITNIIAPITFTISLISCGHPDPPAYSGNQAVSVNLSKVAEKTLVYYDVYPATTVALKEVELRCEVGGDVKGMFFNEGQHVRKGQKLYEIDRSKYEAAFNQAKANLDIAQSNQDRSQRDADRYIELGKEDAIARQRLDNSLTDLQNTKLQVLAAKAGLAKAETDLNYSVINAPFDGTIGISNVRMGALVTPDQTLLNIISSDDPMGVDFVIDEKELERFQLLEKRPFAPIDSTFRIILADNSLYPISGKISIIDRAVDPQTGTVKVRLSFANPNGALKPGMNCNVKVLNENSGLQLVAPMKAVVEQMGEYFVYKVDSLKAKEIKVSLGAKIGPDVIVHNGLNAGDFIVVDGVQRLHNGSSVMVNKEKPGDSKNK